MGGLLHARKMAAGRGEMVVLMPRQSPRIESVPSPDFQIRRRISLRSDLGLAAWGAAGKVQRVGYQI